MNAPLRTGNGLWFINGHVTLVDAPAGMTISDHHLPHGDAPPAHVHQDEEEVFHIKSGRIRFRVGDEEFLAQAGDTVVAPRGVPHAFRVESPEGARALIITNGGNFEGLIRDFSRPASDLGLPEQQAITPSLAAALTSVCARNGIDVVGPPLAA